MAITKNSIIYYKDLIDASKEMIKNIAQNIGSYTGNIPSSYRPGNSTTTPNISRWEPHTRYVYKATNMTYMPENDGTLSIVQVSQFENEFDSFMESRGILAKANQPITTRGMINFYNNLAAFCGSRLLLVSGDPFLNDGRSVVYYKSGSDIQVPSVPMLPEGNLLTSAEVNTSLSLLMNTMNNVNKGYVINYTYEGHSS